MVTRTSKPTRRITGFTLVEMTIAVALAVVVFAAIQSAMLVAARAAGPVTAGPPDAQRAIDIFNADLACATAASGLSATSITLTVPDRTGDGVAETIRYGWTGVRGAPLVRTINATATNLLANAYDFLLAYDSVTETLPATYTTSAEVQLGSFTTDPVLGGGGILGGILGGLGDLLGVDGGIAITSSDWVGQYIKPTIPSSVSSWAVTRALVKAKRNTGTSGVARVQICNVSANNTPTTVIDYVRMLESSLTTSYAWQQASFTTVKGLAPGAGIAVVVRWENDAQACDVVTNSLGALLFSNFVRTTNGGSSWSGSLTDQMLYQLYGTYSTKNPDQTRTRLTAVRSTLQPSTDVATTVRSAGPVLNKPEVTLP